MTQSILLISRCPPYPLHFGDRLIIWHLARLLADRGYTIDLLALTQLASDKNNSQQYAHFFRDVQLFPEAQRTQWMYLKRLLGAHHPHQQDEAWQPDMWQAIQTKLHNHTYDVIHLFGGVHVYEFAHLLHNQATVITPYESYSLYLKRALAQQFNLQTWLNRQITRQFERWMFSLYDRTVVLTEYDQAELLEINPNLPVEVIPNGIDLSDFQVMSTQRDPATLLFVGNYDYPPNHDAAIILAEHIFPQILESVPDAKLLLVGNAPSDTMLKLSSDAITVTGRVERVQDYLASATIFICPLRVGAGIKNKVLEALAMGIPTIATPLSMEGIDVIEKTHALIADINTMAEKTIDLLNDPSLQKTLSKHAPTLIAERYSWESVVAQYEDLYHNINLS